MSYQSEKKLWILTFAQLLLYVLFCMLEHYIETWFKWQPKQPFSVTNIKLFLCVWSPCFQSSSLPHHGTIANLASLRSVAEFTRSQLNGKGMGGIREAFIIIFISTMKKQLLRFYYTQDTTKGLDITPNYTYFYLFSCRNNGFWNVWMTTKQNPTWLHAPVSYIMVCYNLIEACIYKVDKIMFFNFYIIVIVLIYQTSVYQAPGEPFTSSIWVWSIVWVKLIMAVIPVNLDISVAYHNNYFLLTWNLMCHRKSCSLQSFRDSGWQILCLFQHMDS